MGSALDKLGSWNKNGLTLTSGKDNTSGNALDRLGSLNPGGITLTSGKTGGSVETLPSVVTLPGAKTGIGSVGSTIKNAETRTLDDAYRELDEKRSQYNALLPKMESTNRAEQSAARAKIDALSREIKALEEETAYHGTGADAFKYASERAAAGLLSAGENVTDFIGSGFYKLAQGVTSLGGYAPNAVSEKMGEQADRFLDNSVSSDYEQSIRERYHPTRKMEQVSGLGQTVVQMLPAVGASTAIAGAGNAINAANQAAKGANAGKVIFGLQAAGGSASEAKAEGASSGQALAYGTASGLLETAIESIAGGIPGLGSGKLREVAGILEANPAVAKALDIAGEGGEEGLSALLTPYLKRAIYDNDAASATAEEIAQSVIMGMAAAGVLQAGIELPNYIGSHVGVFLPGSGLDTHAETQQTVQSNVTSPTQTTTAQNVTAAAQDTVTQKAAPGAAQTQKNTAHNVGAALPKMTMADFTDANSPVWNNIDYDDTAAQSAIMRTTHQEMVDAGEVVQIPFGTIKQVEQSYPDLRAMKKSERTTILRQKINELKTSLRQFLNGLKGGSYEFEVNGNILEAKLYDTGVREVMEKITQDKASMLYHSDEVFQNARYLYSIPDYDGDPNIYRWNYFYTPVQIGEETVGVRIAVRDMANPQESQIYNWNIKQDATLDGGGRGQGRSSSGVSSVAPSDPIIRQAAQGVNTKYARGKDGVFLPGSGMDTHTTPSGTPATGQNQVWSGAGTNAKKNAAPDTAQTQKNTASTFGTVENAAGVTPAESEATAVSQLRSAGSETTVSPTDNVASVSEKVNSIINGVLSESKGTASPSDIMKRIMLEMPNNAAKEAAVESFDALLSSGEYGVNAAGQVRKTDAENHIDNRSFSSVGNRKIPSFQFDNPQLHEYFAEAARMMQSDLSMSTKGERFPISSDMREWSGAKRGTTDEVVALKDDAKLSYAEIDKALEAIIQDQGQENYAAAKKVEIMLDSMLTNGYTDVTGFPVPPNENYIQEKSKIAGSNPMTYAKENDTLPLYDVGEKSNPHADVERGDVDGFGQNTVGAALKLDANGNPIGPESSVGAATAGFDPYSHLQNQTDKFHPEGEKAYRQVDVPTKDFDGRNIPKATATVMEAQATPDSAVGVIQDAIAKGQFSFDTITDKKATQRARDLVTDKGWEGALEAFHQAAARGVLSKDNVALGALLLDNAMNSQDSEATVKILTDYASMSTTAAQSLQAQRLLKKMSPEWQLYGIQRSVSNMQEELTKKYGDKAPNLEIPDDLVQNFLDARDQAGRDAAIEEIYKSIAAQTPANWLDKWNAWRYMAMLTNPRTHIRNIAGNVGFAPVRLVKDALATAMEAGVDYLSPNGIERTKAALNPASSADRALVKAALADVENVQDQLLGNGKYVDSATGKIEEYRTIFKFKPLETVRKANSAAMDAEDTWFSKPTYAGALAGYLKANGVTAQALENGGVDGKLLDAARSYAVREAQRATYRDANAFSDFVAGLRYRGKNPVGQAGNMLMEGVLPFRRTPANILVRGVEYSPAGLVKGLTYDLYQVHKGNMTAAQAIDDIAAGLTGFGLPALGVWLASMGLISGGGSGDDDQDAQDDLTGGQSYALSIGGKNFTLDWLAPEALPFFVGVELYNTLSDKSEEGFQLKDALEAMERITDPMLEMSMLQGVQDMIDNVRYADGGTLLKVMANAAISYLTQAVPTLFGQIERTMEGQRYSTFVDRESGLPNDAQYTLGSVMNKLPGEFQQIPYIDAWGRTEETGSLLERAFNNFLNPSYVSKEIATDVDNELQRLYDAGQAGVFPDRVSQSDQVTYKENPDDKESQKRYLTAGEYVEYATIKGQTSYDIVDAMIGSDFYKSMTDEQKADAIKLAYTYAGHLAAEEVTDGKHESEKYVELAQAAQKELGLSEAEYLMLYKEYGGTAVNGDKVREACQNGIDPVDYLEYDAGKKAYNEDGSGSLTIAENAKAIQNSGLSASEQEIMWLLTYPEWAEKAAEKGVSNSEYTQYKVATYGCTKKAEKLAALVAAGFSTAEARTLVNKIG